jgi:hypothetical protein
MRAPRLEVAEVFRRYQDDYLAEHPASPGQRRVLRDLVACRTAALGGHLRRCDTCGHEEIAYNSCRNRHCPKCQRRKQADWLEAQCARLLPVPYYHIVFTLPEDLGPLALQNPRVLYGLLFRAAAETLTTLAADPRYLGARIGFTAVLHTWGQTLLHHPHVHCLVPAGGLSADGQHWVQAREGFFLPVRVLSRLFRAKYLAYLREAYDADELAFFGALRELTTPGAWRTFLAKLYKTEWVVYAKPPFGSPEQVLKYLARYTHRVAISNGRLLSIDGGHVAFRYKDYRRGRIDRVMRLSATEFIRRFLLHVLPKGFVRIRHYGLLANRRREDNLALCRRLLQAPRPPEPTAEATDSTEAVATADSPRTPCDDLCPICTRGHLILVGRVPPWAMDNRPRAGPDRPVNTFAYA